LRADNRLRIWDRLVGVYGPPDREIVHSHDFNRYLTVRGGPWCWRGHVWPGWILMLSPTGSAWRACKGGGAEHSKLLARDLAESSPTRAPRLDGAPCRQDTAEHRSALVPRE